ncbi:MAG: DUF2062 domain-containing protein [Chthoniobacterales bacterium]
MKTWNLKQFARAQFAALHQIRDQPHAVAGGVAIGMFWGFTPLTGLKTLFSIACAWVFRCSKIAAAVAVSFHDILTPVWPIILRWEYDLGYWLLSHPHRFPPHLHMGEGHWRDWFHLKTLQVLWPMFLGSLAFAIPISLVSYWIVEKSLERYQHQHNSKSVI